jgi:hypothetical protein
MGLGAVSIGGWIVAASAAGLITFHSDVRPPQNLLRLGDVADVSVLPDALRERAVILPLLRLPKGKDDVQISTGALKSRARALIPALGPWFGEKAEGTVHVRRMTPRATTLLAQALTDHGVAKGDKVRVTLRTGIFTIERDAVAMSNAKPGQRFFARTTDHKALPVLCCGE